jgi:hypothetical protein
MVEMKKCKYCSPLIAESQQQTGVLCSFRPLQFLVNCGDDGLSADSHEGQTNDNALKSIIVQKIYYLSFFGPRQEVIQISVRGT